MEEDEGAGFIKIFLFSFNFLNSFILFI